MKQRFVSRAQSQSDGSTRRSRTFAPTLRARGALHNSWPRLARQATGKASFDRVSAMRELVELAGGDDHVLLEAAYYLERAARRQDDTRLC